VAKLYACHGNSLSKLHKLTHIVLLLCLCCLQIHVVLRSFNPAGQSPPFCVEYYTGWLTHWGEAMTHSEAADVAATLADILAAANNTASANLYMAAGGTNFGPWAGANVFQTLGQRQQQQMPGPAQWRLRQAALQQQQGATAADSRSSSRPELYQPHITSYDYNCPIGEAGTVGQLGMGGASKFDALRDVIAAAQGISVQQLPPLPPPVPLVAYDPVVFSEGLYLLDALPELSASCRGSTYCSTELGQGGTSSSGEHAGGCHRHQGYEHHVNHSTHHTAAQRGGQHAQTKSWRMMLQQLPRLLAAKQPFTLGPADAKPQHAEPQQQQHKQQASAGDVTTDSAGEQQQDGSDVQAAAAAAASAPGPVQSSSRYPLPMEQYGQYYGLIMYQTVLAGQQAAAAGGRLRLTAHDTVWVFLDGQLLGRSYRSAPASIQVPPSPFSGRQAAADSSSPDQQGEGTAAPVAGMAAVKRLLAEASGSSSEGRVLQLLVWPLGRNNFGLFGSSMNDQKGLLGNVSLAGQVLTGWAVTHLCLEGRGPDAFSSLHLPWRPLAPAGAAAEAGGAGMHWQGDSKGHSSRQAAAAQGSLAAGAAGSESNDEAHSSMKQHAAGRPVLVLPGSSAWLAQKASAGTQEQQSPGHDSSSSSAGGMFSASNITAFIATVAEAQAQAVIAAAADAASGNGPATAAARAAATIRAGRAAEAAADASINAAQRAKGPLLLRGMLHVPANATMHSSSSQQQQQSPLLPPGRPADTFLHLGEGWGRGQVWVNGHSLGSYWADQGPQMSLYLPGSFLQAGPNEVVLLELDGALPATLDGPLSIACADAPDFGGPAAGPAPL
jgi:hypothetical protein